MQNSPDPEEEEEVLEEEDGGEISSQADSVLLQEMQALTQTFNNNWSYEGEDPRAGFIRTRNLLGASYWFLWIFVCVRRPWLAWDSLYRQGQLALTPHGSSCFRLKDGATVPCPGIVYKWLSELALCPRAESATPSWFSIRRKVSIFPGKKNNKVE